MPEDPSDSWQPSSGVALRTEIVVIGAGQGGPDAAAGGAREPDGGIVVTGRLATQVAKDPRIHLVGYGPSASTIGANRAGGAAAIELMATLELRR